MVNLITLFQNKFYVLRFLRGLLNLTFFNSKITKYKHPNYYYFLFIVMSNDYNK